MPGLISLYPTPLRVNQVVWGVRGATGKDIHIDFAANGYGAPAIKRMQVSAASQTANFQYDLKDKPYGGMGWQPKTWSFVAKAASTTLGFTSLDTENGYFGPVIDNVRVQAACD